MKMRQLKKVLSITLAVSMLTASVPMDTFATDGNQTEQSTEYEEKKVKSAAETKAAKEQMTEAQTGETKETKEQTTEAQTTETKETKEQMTEAQTGETQTEAQTSETQTTEAQTTVQKPAMKKMQKMMRTAKEMVSLSWSTEEAVYSDGTAIALPEVTFQTADGQQETIKTIEITGDTALVDGAIVNAGTYTLKAVLTEAQKEKYEIVSKESIPFTVNKKELDVSWDTTIKDSVTYDGKEHYLALTGEGAENFEIEYKDAQGTPVEAPTDAGEYTVSVKENQNYKPKTELGKKILTIQKQDVTIEWGITDLTYNGNAQCPTASFKAGEAEVETSVTVKVEGDAVAKNVGTYTAYVDANDYPNYELSGNTRKEFSIKKLEININLNYS